MVCVSAARLDDIQSTAIVPGAPVSVYSFSGCGRRVGKVLATILLSASMMGGSPIPAIGAVGEGDLPDGALAFSRLLKFKADWGTLASSVNGREGSIDDKETLSIKAFLKQLANEYYDMDLLSKSITDVTKATDAKALAKSFRVSIRECDDAASGK